jgi:Ubiquitin family
MTSWTISVKTVGHGGDFSSNDFVINVKPDDGLTSLNDQIEKYTGLKASQQRLIYRGRIIRGAENDVESISDEPKVKDVVGLGDGQTIHLVPRLESIEQPPVTIVEQQTLGSSQAESVTSGISRIRRPRTPDNDSSPNPSGTASLLAAILGIGGMENDDPTEEPMSLGQQLARLRSVRARSRNHRPNHRLTQSDLEQQDPGSMEPVRQGLLTLHTMLQGNVQQQKPLRQFYKGQWIDCLDTVNQWLEATIVEIMKPEDLLPPPLLLDSFQERRNLHPSLPSIDPVVSAQDFDGRVRLLLEPSEDTPLDCEWGSYRQRKNNEGVQLLLIHYNGWPHRWDEWIRSDSSRIRLFRTRTRHPTSVS